MLIRKNGLILGAFLLSMMTWQANAAIVDNGDYTTDTLTGLDWLDLTATAGLSYTAVSGQLGSSGSFSGWRYATREDVATLYFNFSGFTHTPGSFSYDGETVYDELIDLLGDTLDKYLMDTFNQSYCEYYAGLCITGDLRSASGLTSDVLPHNNYQLFVYILDNDLTPDGIDFMGSGYQQPADSPAGSLGSFLIRDSSLAAAPIPSALLLFSTGLLGLLFVRKKFRAG